MCLQSEVSSFQQDVATLLRHLRVAFDFEAVVEDGLVSIDIACRSRDGKKVAIEVRRISIPPIQGC